MSIFLWMYFIYVEIRDMFKNVIKASPINTSFTVYIKYFDNL